MGYEIAADMLTSSYTRKIIKSYSAWNGHVMSRVRIEPLEKLLTVHLILDDKKRCTLLLTD